MKKKLAIFQNDVMEYRIPLFEGLSTKYDVTVYYTSSAVDCEGKKFKLLKLPTYKLLGFYFSKGMKKIFNEHDVFLVMFDLRYLNFVSAALFTKNTVLWTHGLTGNKLANLVRLFLIKKVRSLLVYDDNQKHIIESYLGERTNTKVTSSDNTVCVENPMFENTARRHRFLYTGRYQRRKGLERLLKSFSSIKGKVSEDINLTFIGPGFDDSFRNLVEHYGLLDRVEIIGPVYDEKVLYSYFQEALAYVSPGHVGLGVLHSFAYGVPVVTSSEEKHAPEFENCVDNFNSLLIKSDEDLTRILFKLAMDRSLSFKLGENSYHYYLEKRSMKNMIHKVSTSIEQALVE